jgi:hypothetical protein
VAVDGSLAGVVYLDDVTGIERLSWPGITAGEVSRGAGTFPVTRPDDAAWTLFVPFMQQGRAMIPVTGRDGLLAGIVTRRDFTALLDVTSSVMTRK